MSVSQTAVPSAAREVSGFLLLVAIIMLFAAGKAVLHDTMDPDFFWHMRVAEQLHNEGIHPLVDQISFASVKTPWTPYSWLAELGMKWLWDHTGLRGAIATQALLEAGLVLLVAMCAIQQPDSRPGMDRADLPLLSAVLATAFAMFLAMPFLSFRPVMIAIDLMAVCSWLLLRDRRIGQRSRAVWLVPVLTALVINVHIFAVFVPIWVGALWAGALFERDWRALRHYAVLLILCVLGCCCTPVLGGTLASIRDYTTTNPLTANSMIVELEPMYRGTSRQITLAAVIIVLLVGMIRRKARIGDWIWVLGMGILFAKCGRAAPIFAPIFAAVMSRSLPQLSDRVLGKPIVNIATGALVLIGAVRIGLYLPNNTYPDAWFNRRGPDLPGYPSEAAAYVQNSVPQTTGRLINEFDWGGYLAWKLPSYQVLLDGRTQLYKPEFWLSLYLGTNEQCQQALSQISADAAILPAHRSRFRKPLESLGWKCVHQDDWADVLIPPASAAQTDQ